jgi:hypothetical protein
MRRGIETGKLKWSADASYLVSRGDVVFRSDSRMFSLPGATVIHWIDSLIPKLKGECALEDALVGFPPSQQENVRRFLLLLIHEGLIEVLANDLEAPLESLLRRQFHYQLELLTHLTASPIRRFLQFRHSSVLVAGSGIALTTSSAALLRSGLEQVSILPLRSSEGEEVIENAASELRSAGAKAEFLILKDEPDLERYDLVAYCSDQVCLSEILKLNRQAVRARRPFLPGFAFQNWGFLGPIISTENRGCWVCGFRRLVPHIDGFPPDAGFLEGPTPVSEQKADKAAACEVATDQAFAIFKALAGNLRPQFADSMLVQRRLKGETFKANLIQQPLCACMGYCKRYAHT